MITKVTVENFRSIERTELELASLVLLYGPTASGKSSLLYAPIVLKNFILNPEPPGRWLLSPRLHGFGWL